MEKVHNQAILFMGLGSGGIEILAELPRAAEDLSVRIAGPFSSICIDEPSSPVRMSHCSWLSDLKVSRNTVSFGSDKSICVSGSNDTLSKELSSLIRRLSAGAMDRVQSGILRERIQVYVIIDLDTPGIVPSAMKLIQLVRQVEPSLEMTGLALTGRTVKSGHSPVEPWFEQIKVLLSELQKPYLLQRLYILDGIDANGTWLPGLEHMHHVGAEFILHHGLSPYRHQLRRRERTRASFQESFLSYCGSLTCRHFSCDRSTVEKSIAAVLIQDQNLADMERGSLTKERCRTLDTRAQELTNEIVHIYEQNELVPDENEASGRTVDPTGDEEDNKKVADAIEKTLTEVCAERPVLSLRYFLSALGQKLRELSTFSQLRMRWDARYRVAESLRKQMQETYGPMKAWQKVKGVKWRSRFDPWPLNLPTVTLNRPVPRTYYALGMFGVGLGLILLALGGFLQNMALLMIGGIGAITACAFRVLGTGWIRHERTVISQERGDTESAPEHKYASRMPVVSVWIAVSLLTPGLFCIGWSMLSGRTLVLEPLALLFGPVPIVFALAGATLLLFSRMRAPWPDMTSLEQEMPDLAPPLNRRWYYAGLVLFVVAWVLLCLGLGASVVLNNVGVFVTGLGLTWSGLSVIFYPRVSTTKLIYRVPGRPAPLEPVAAKSIEASRLLAQADRLCAWVDRLVNTREDTQSRLPEWRDSSLETSILDMFSPQWASYLADAFAQELQAGPSKSLVHMAGKPAHWVDYVVRGLSDPDVELSDPLFVFAQHHVKHWLKDKSWGQIIRHVNPDPPKIHDAIAAAVPPRWPQTRNDPEVDTSVIAVGKELWELIAPFVDQNSAHWFQRVEWQDPNSMTVTRIVQGLSGGWRGHDGLPGQAGAGQVGTSTEDQTPAEASENEQKPLVLPKHRCNT
jgi:hypothetical protein